MDRMLKIFVTGADQDRLAGKLSVVERYTGFLLARMPEQDVEGIAAEFPVEDITDQYRIRAGQRTIDTDTPRIDHKGKTRSHPDYKGVKRLSQAAHHYLVQFVGPIKKGWLSKVEKAGGKLQSPYSGFSYVVQADDSTLATIAALPFIRWTGHLSHSDRVSPAVLKYAKRKATDTGAELPRSRVLPGLYVAEFFDVDTLKAAVSEVEGLGFEVLERDEAACFMILKLVKSGGVAKSIRELSAVHGVKSIREHSLKRTSNDIAPRLMGAQKVLSSDGLGLDGAGEVVAVCDTGLDTGDPSSIHPDFKGRIAAIMSYPIKNYYTPFINNPGGDDGPGDYDSGHGTHVTGSVLGSGMASEGLSGIEAPIRGLAHKAKLVLQAVEQAMEWKNPEYYNSIGRYLLAGIPGDIQTLFADAYQKKARIHSNSWGGGEPGVYDAQSRQLDRFVWEHKDFCVLVAAGNDGSDNDGNGRINPMSVTSPATAKNCICVGACENDRTSFNHHRYGGWWPTDYPVAPFRNDPMADNPEQVVAFSSRGPTEDGRIRPDVVAPGTFVLSTRSTMIAGNNNAWAAFPASRKYFHMGGTSMATPLAAGAAALVRQYLRRDAGISKPSAALIKAALVAGARRLPGTDESGTLADNEQGFGRVNLEAVLAPADPARVEFIDNDKGLETGEVWSRELTIHSDDVPLRLVMAYSDYPGEGLINNLNLILTGPDGKRYVGNPAMGGGLQMDAMNNVEVIEVHVPPPGSWKIEVVASSIPQSVQDFALVIIGAQGETPESSMIRVESHPNKAIPDNDRVGISDVVNVEQQGIASSVAVDVDISHTYIGDLLVVLTSPDGTEVTLHQRQGASANDIRKRFDVHTTPDLGLLTGFDIAGEWRLDVSDQARIDKGTLNSWAVEIIVESSAWVEVEAEPALMIPDNDSAGISDSLEVVGTGAVRELEVWVDITHTWIGDLQVSLTSPAGVTVPIHERIGGSRDNLIAIFDRQVLPGLDAFNSGPGAGGWTLNVSDNAGRDVGKLNAWGLRVRF
ncbi:MAG: S8 family serine peptidase [Desulfobulbaceae bacterium]|nr:S8 family serine peptidase [Desulfobulbaceae bacterium]